MRHEGSRFQPSAAKVLMCRYLRQGPVGPRTLVSDMQSLDLTKAEIHTALQDLLASGTITLDEDLCVILRELQP